MKDYVVVVTSLEHTSVAIEFNIPHDRAVDVIQFLTQFTHEIRRKTRDDQCDPRNSSPKDAGAGNTQTGSAV